MPDLSTWPGPSVHAALPSRQGMEPEIDQIVSSARRLVAHAHGGCSVQLTSSQAWGGGAANDNMEILIYAFALDDRVPSHAVLTISFDTGLRANKLIVDEVVGFDVKVLEGRHRPKPDVERADAVCKALLAAGMTAPKEYHPDDVPCAESFALRATTYGVDRVVLQLGRLPIDVNGMTMQLQARRVSASASSGAVPPITSMRCESEASYLARMDLLPPLPPTPPPRPPPPPPPPTPPRPPPPPPGPDLSYGDDAVERQEARQEWHAMHLPPPPPPPSPITLGTRHFGAVHIGVILSPFPSPPPPMPPSPDLRGFATRVRPDWLSSQAGGMLASLFIALSVVGFLLWRRKHEGARQRKLQAIWRKIEENACSEFGCSVVGGGASYDAESAVSTSVGSRAVLLKSLAASAGTRGRKIGVDEVKAAGRKTQEQDGPFALKGEAASAAAALQGSAAAAVAALKAVGHPAKRNGSRYEQVRGTLDEWGPPRTEPSRGSDDEADEEPIAEPIVIPKKGKARAPPPGDPNVCTLPMGTCFCASSPQPSPRTTDAAAGAGAGLKFGGQPAFVPPRRGGRRGRAATDVGVRTDRPSWGPAVVAPKATKAKSVVTMDD